jgi:hypothetical protein
MTRGFLTPNQHGAVEPFMAVFVAASPWIFGFSSSAARNVALMAGVLILLTGWFTKWKPAMFHLISLRAHFGLDLAIGGMLVLSPLLLGFAGETVPSLVLPALGLLEIGAALVTRWNEQPFDVPDRGPTTVEDGSTLVRNQRSREGFAHGAGATAGDPVSDDPESPPEWPDPGQRDRPAARTGTRR